MDMSFFLAPNSNAYFILGENSASNAIPLGMAGFIIICSALYFLLPKTKHVHLPQSVADAKRMRR